MTPTSTPADAPIFIGYEVSPVACINKTAEAFASAADAEAALTAAENDGDDTEDMVWGLYGQLPEGGVRHIADLSTETAALELYRAITGKPQPQPQNGRHLLPANLPQTARVVLVVEGGVVQNILADRATVDVLVKDYDTEGCDPDDKQVYTDDEGGRFGARIGPDQIDAAEVEKCFAQLDDEVNHWVVSVDGLKGDFFVTPEQGDTLTTVTDVAKAEHFPQDEVETEVRALRAKHTGHRFEAIPLRDLTP